MMVSFRLASIVFFLLAGKHVKADEGLLCLGQCSVAGDGSKTCTFTAKVDLFASEWGYFTFDECGNQTNPTLGLEQNVTYIFDQSDISNYKHPLGFAYFPDGAHDDKPELEPGVAPSCGGSPCVCENNLSCPAPMYILNGQYLGVYSNNMMIAPVTTGEDNFGLDDYEPLFFYPIVDWVQLGNFSVVLKLTEAMTEDIFYFCHVHQFMSARAKVVDSTGQPLQTEDKPDIPYVYEDPSDYDKKCGTTNLKDFQLPNPQCPSQFVCNVPENTPGLAHFSECLEAMDCAMVVGMTNGVSAESEVALFIHQMIPHHQNAVNMAKALLKTGAVQCNDFTGDDPDCIMEQILRDIINGQNHQIQQMRGILDSKGYPSIDQCVVEFESESSPKAEARSESVNTDSAASISNDGYKHYGIYGSFFAMFGAVFSFLIVV